MSSVQERSQACLRADTALLEGSYLMRTGEAKKKGDREAQQRVRDKKRLAPFMTNGILDFKKYLQSPEMMLKRAKAIEDVYEGKKINPQFLKLVEILSGEYTEKRHASRRIRPGDHFAGEQRTPREAAGLCPRVRKTRRSARPRHQHAADLLS